MTALSLENLREDLGEKTVACATHGDFTSKGVRINLGRKPREIWTVCPGCAADEARAMAESKSADELAAERARMEKRLSMTLLPARFIGRTVDNYRVEHEKQQRAVDICRAFIASLDENLARGASMVFSGPPGTGKSHLAAAILQAALAKHLGLYCTLMDLIRSIRETWRQGSEESESKILKRLAEMPLMVIDEIGVQYDTDAERTLLFEVMDRRYRDQRSTILLTNLGPDDFKKAVGERVYDRLTETAKWVPFDWQSFRKQARKEFQQ